MSEEGPAESFTKNCGLCLVIGIGSPHGDDRAGWEVIERLEKLGLEQFEQPILLRKATVPHDIFDWLHRDTKTHIIDACRSTDASVQRHEIDQDDSGGLHLTSAAFETSTNIGAAFEILQSGSSHQFDLLSTLQLAAALGNLPPHIILWTIPMATTDKRDGLSATTLGYVVDCAARIRGELRDA